jgi:hypothetical protein
MHSSRIRGFISPPRAIASVAFDVQRVISTADSRSRIGASSDDSPDHRYAALENEATLVTSSTRTSAIRTRGRL